MNFEYRPMGVCSNWITLEINDGIVSNVKFIGGCNGNLKGIAAMAEGMKAEDIIEKLSGIRCGFKDTSCPDQLAKALKAAIGQDK